MIGYNFMAKFARKVARQRLRIYALEIFDTDDGADPVGGVQRADGHTPPDRSYSNRAAFPDVWPDAHTQVNPHAAPDRHTDGDRDGAGRIR